MQRRMFSMFAEILENEDAAEERVMERARRRALQSSLISDLRAQYSEAPEEVQVTTLRYHSSVNLIA